MFTVWLVEGEAESDQLRLVEVEPYYVSHLGMYLVAKGEVLEHASEL